MTDTKVGIVTNIILGTLLVQGGIQTMKMNGWDVGRLAGASMVVLGAVWIYTTGKNLKTS